MDRATEYRQYLASPAWKHLRDQAIYRARGCCEMCGQPYENVHHIRYPKQFRDDHVDNLLVLCRYHHELNHGIRRMKITFDDIKTTRFKVGGREIDLRYFVAEDGQTLFNGQDYFYGLGGPKGLAPLGAAMAGKTYTPSTQGNRDVAPPRSTYCDNCLRRITEGYKEYVWIESQDRIGAWWLYEGGVNEMAFMEEFRGNPHARAFRDWVCKDLLPSLRRTGVYALPGHVQAHKDLRAAQVDIAIEWNAQTISQLKNQLAGLEQLTFDMQSVRDKQLELERNKADREEVRSLHAHLHDKLTEVHEEAVRAGKQAALANEQAAKRHENKAETVRLYSLKNGLPTDQSSLLRFGAVCKIINDERKKYPPMEKLEEGTFMVNVVPMDVLREGHKLLYPNR